MVSSFAAEQAVIGDILMDAVRVMPETLLLLTPEDFENESFRAIYSVCRATYLDSRPVDIVTVSSQLDDAYKPILISAAEATPSVTRYAEYIRIVADAAKLRRAAEAASSLLGTLQAGTTVERCRTDAAEVLQALEDKDTRSVNAKDGLLLFLDNLDKPKNYLRTGFGRLDGNVDIERGDYVVVGGRPSTGKTAFTLQIMLRLAEKVKVVYFSLETRPDKLFDRLLSCYSGVDLTDIKHRNISEADMIRITSGMDHFSALRFEVVSAAGWTVEQMRAKSIQLGAQVIIIDYIGLVQGEGRSMYERITQVSMQLHTMAQQLGIAVFALSQLSRGGDGDMASLRDSGQIEQDADVVMLLTRKDELSNDPERELRICKNKDGRCGAVPLYFDGRRQYFSERSDREE